MTAFIFVVLFSNFSDILSNTMIIENWLIASISEDIINSVLKTMRVVWPFVGSCQSDLLNLLFSCGFIP